METESQLTYLGDRVSAGGRCEAAVIARTRLVCVKLRECSELLLGMTFPPYLTGAVHKTSVRPAILIGSEA